jgi:cell division protein FtsQ
VSRTGTTTRDRTRPTRARPPAVVPPRRGGGGRWRLRRGRRHPLLTVALVPLVLATAAWVLWASPLLSVRSVQVDGLRTLTAGEVREAAGLGTGTPLLQVDVAGAAERVRRLPQVSAAQVSRGWPDRVVVTVTERRPVAVVSRDGQRWLVDAGGVLFDAITGDPPAGVVALDVRTPGARDAATRAGLAAIGALPAAVRGQVATVHARTGQDVTLELRTSTTVIWGNAEGARSKAAALRGLLDQISAGKLDKATTIDLSTPDAVVLH